MKDILTIIGTQILTRRYANFEGSDERDYIVFSSAGSRKWAENNYLCVKLGVPDWMRLNETDKAKALEGYPEKERNKLLAELYKDDGFAVMQIHKPVIFKMRNNPSDPRDGMPGEKHWEWLQKKHPFKIYMLEKYDGIPSAVKYPFDEVYNIIEPYLGIKLFRSSADFIMALAILKGYKTIEIVGVEMASGSEYDYQKPGFYFWTGVAIGKGIKVVTLDKSVLFSGMIYGYEGEIVINRSKFEIRLRELKNEVVKRQQVITALSGKLDEYRVAGDTDNYRKTVKEYEDAIYEFGIVAGQHAENQNYLGMCDDMIQALGGDKALIEKNAEENYAA